MKQSVQDDPVLGASPGALQLDRRHLIRHTSIQMANQARRELLLFGPALDSGLYGHGPFLSALQRLALARPVLPVRILIFDSRQTYLTGHGLIELARRLTSRISIRRVDENDQDRLNAFLIADECGFISRRMADTMDALADFNNPGEARRLRATFNGIWERSDADLELLRLYL